MMQHQHDVSSCIMALAWSSFLGHELTYTRKCFQNWRAVFLNIFVGSQERNNNPVHRRLTAPTSASTRCNGGRCAHLPCQTSLRLLWMSWVFQEVHTVWNGHSLTLGEPWTLVEDRGRAFFPGRFTPISSTQPPPTPSGLQPFPSVGQEKYSREGNSKQHQQSRNCGTLIYFILNINKKTNNT